MKLNKNQILEYQQNRNPYLMIDSAEEIIPGKIAKGYKDLTIDEWFFKVHWPNDPNMPGMLQIEALVQMSALSILTLPGNKGKIMYNKIQSDEGGRFYHAQSKNMVVQVHEKEVIRLNDNYTWMTHNQVLHFIKKGIFNIEARILFACFNIKNIL